MELPFDKEHASAYLGAALIALQGALDHAVEALASAHGTQDLAWLDELQREAIRSSKGIVTEAIAMETETGALKFATGVIDAMFQTYRKQYGQNSP